MAKECCVCMSEGHTKEEIDNWDRHAYEIPLLCKTCNSLTCSSCIFDIGKQFRKDDNEIKLNKGHCPVCKTIDYKYIFNEELLWLLENYDEMLWGELPWDSPIYNWVKKKSLRKKKN